MAGKSWTEKFHNKREAEVKTLEKDFSDMISGETMLIATPRIIDHYIRSIPPGKKSDIKTMRQDLALDHKAVNTCPLTTGIFLRIVAEKAHEDFNKGKRMDEITPFWRIIDPRSPLARKLSFNLDPYLQNP